MYIYICMYDNMCVCIYIYIYIRRVHPGCRQLPWAARARPWDDRARHSARPLGDLGGHFLDHLLVLPEMFLPI